MADRFSMQDASQAAGFFARAAAHALQSADSVNSAAGVLEAVLDLLVRPNADEAALASALERLGGSGTQALQQAAQRAGWEAVRASFAAQHAEALAGMAMQEVAAEWMPKDTSQLLLGLIRELFAAVPAPAVLDALVGHLSLVEPPAGRPPVQRRSRQAFGDSVVVEVAGSDVAATLLAERFAAAASTGVPELVTYFAGHQLTSRSGNCSNARQQPAVLPTSSGRVWDADEAAGQLASVPDRVCHMPNMPPELAGPRFVGHALVQAITALQQQQQQELTAAPDVIDVERVNSQHTTSTSAAGASNVSDSANSSDAMRAADPGTAFVAVLLQRMVARGHGATAAGTLLQLQAQAGGAAAEGIGSNSIGMADIVPSVLAQLASSHQAATEKLLTELLLQLSSHGSSSETSVRSLHTLLPAPLLQPGSPARYLLCEKLLLRRTLPTNALQLLLSFLETARPSLLPEAALTLAQAWAEPQGVTHTKLPQQAYMAQALQGCLALLPKAALEVGSSPLLGALLQGVSARLGSPLPAVRRQGMRVGKALSVRLDPAKPLFGDQGDLALLREELWFGAVTTTATATAAAAGVGLNGAAKAAAGAATSAASAQAAAGPQQATGRGAGGGSSSEGPSSPPPASGRLSATLARLDEAAAAPDSDDEEVTSDGSDDDGSDADSIRAYDLHEDLEAESWEAAHWQSGKEPGAGAAGAAKPVVALRPLAAALRKADDVNAVLDALKRVEVLVRANPEELLSFAPELARSLLHCRAPEWAEAEAASPADAPEAQRARALVALLAMAPVEAGDQVLEEVYSPHLDVYQRLLILDSLCATAKELADPRTAPQLQLGSGAPQLVQPARGTKAALQGSAAGGAQGSGSTAGQTVAELGRGQEGGGGGAVVPGGLRQARTRVWGNVALRKMRESEAAAPRTFRNRFTGVAVRWAAALLRECDVRRHGVDLFGRDGLLLGRLLTTLGTFAECAGQTHAAVPLAAGTLELLRAPQVSGSEQPYVRRCALLAAAQVVSSLPPARLAGALVGQTSDAQDAVLVERLQWLQAWAAGAAAGDMDDNCRLLAAAVVGMQAELASASMAVLQTLPPPAEHGLRLGGVGSGGGGGGGGRGMSGISIQMPRVNQLQHG